MARTYELISCDSHLNEPPNLYIDRVAAKYRERAPRLERFEQGHAWIIEGIPDPINFGMNVTAGLPYEKVNAWMFFEDVRKGGYDPAERLREMDMDRVDAEVLYPTPRLSYATLWHRDDPDFQIQLVRAYNDWLSEYCSLAPDRLLGLAQIPTTGIEAAMAELERAAKLPGIRAAVLVTYPNGGLEITEEDDRFWARCQELGMPVNIHVTLMTRMPSENKNKLPGDMRFFDAPVRTMQFIFGDVFERFPDLKLVFAETDCGWVPYFKEQLDDRYKRIHIYSKLHLKKPPSAYFDSNVLFTYITDRYGVMNRHQVGLDSMLWSSDYPHIGADWPNSWTTIEEHFVGAPEAEKHQILAGNAAKLYCPA